MPNLASHRYTNDVLMPVCPPEQVLQKATRLAPGAYVKGQCIGYVASGASEVQTITRVGTAASGVFAIAWNGYQTVDLAYDASAAVVQAALQALPNIGAGNVTVAISSLVTTITFAGALANKPVAAITVAKNTMETSVPAAVTTTVATATAGVWPKSGRAYTDGDAILGFLAYGVTVDADGVMTTSSNIAAEYGLTQTEVPVFIRGVFRAGDLSGITSDTKAELGYREIGDATSGSGDSEALVLL